MVGAAFWKRRPTILATRITEAQHSAIALARVAHTCTILCQVVTMLKARHEVGELLFWKT